MSVTVKRIEIENFKSFKGKFVIDALKSFTAVIGPNGSGKSNFMDAISFVMGEKSNTLRVKKLSDLIYRASIGQPVSDVASVAAVFQLKHGNEKKFMRFVRGSSSHHQINGNNVTSETYLTELGELGINVKAQNFLVFQGSVESLAMKSPKELTALFEEISGSGAFKAEYERLKMEMSKAEEATNFLFHKKKGMATERKGAEMEKKEAKEFRQLQNQYAKMNVEMQLFCLYHNALAIENLAVSKQEMMDELETLEEPRLMNDYLLKKTKKDAGAAIRQLEQVDQRVKESEAEVAEIKTNYIEAKENVRHLRVKSESIGKCLEQARIAANVKKNEIRQIEEMLKEIEAAKAKYVESVAGQDHNRSRDVHLQDQQIREYNILKGKATTACTVKLQQLDSINRLLKSDQDRLENDVRKKRDLESKIKQISLMRDEAKKREEKLTESIASLEASLQDYRKTKMELESAACTSEERVEELQRELKIVSEQLSDAVLDTNELAKRKNKHRVVAALSSRFPGVYDRVVHMCEPIHSRYNIAVTKVFGKFLDAIVIETEHTARQCIQYLKDQCLDPETFLPLDYILVKPRKHRPNMIEEPRNVKLLYDVVTFSPDIIKPAVRFLSRNTLICETPEDASKIAYNTDASRQYDCVALDGTFYQRNGIISGGSLDLAKRAKRWNEKQIGQLEMQKKKVTESLKEELLNFRNDAKLRGFVAQFNGSEGRLKYLNADLKQTTNQIKQREVELQDLKRELEKLESTIAGIEDSIALRKLEMENIKQEMNAEEDKIFEVFCEKIGVSNIREYEEHELSAQQERENKLLDFENQCNRIRNQLDFERQRDTESNISRWVQNLDDAETKLRAALLAEDQIKAKFDRKLAETANLQTLRKEIKENVDRKLEKVIADKQEVSTVAKQILNIRRQLNEVETAMDREKNKRHALLVDCKVKNIPIPMIFGNLDVVANESSSIDDEADVDSSRDQRHRESQIVIDYGQLADELKGMEGPDIRRTKNNLRREIEAMRSTLEKIEAPNMKANERLALIVEKFEETNAEFEVTRKNASKVKREFEKVQKERRDRFTEYFDCVAKEIERTYKGLTKNRAAQAFLTAENPEEPYLAGINYNCVVPGKRFTQMSNLSGGEKTVAALTLLFAFHSVNPASFIVLDEIDAALDNTNISRVANYIREKSNTLQTIVISLKDEFYSHAQALIGISPEVDGKGIVSKVVTLDLSPYAY